MDLDRPYIWCTQCHANKTIFPLICPTLCGNCFIDRERFVNRVHRRRRLPDVKICFTCASVLDLGATCTRCHASFDLTPDLWAYVYSWLTVHEAARVEQASRACKSQMQCMWQEYMHRDWRINRKWPAAYDICIIEGIPFRECYKDLHVCDIRGEQWGEMADQLAKPWHDVNVFPPLSILKELRCYEIKAAMLSDLRFVILLANLYYVMGKINTTNAEAARKRDAYVNLAIGYARNGLKLPLGFYNMLGAMYALRDNFKVTEDYVFILETGIKLGSVHCYSQLHEVAPKIAEDARSSCPSNLAGPRT